MKYNNDYLTAARLRELLDYDPHSGIFRWRARPHKRGGSVRIGDIAGNRRGNGYLGVGIDGRPFLLHRLAWLYVFGRWPAAELDHIDRDPANNRIDNLREATRAQNQANTRTSRRNKLRIRGVHIARGKFSAFICKDHRRIWLGYFDTAEEASAAYQTAARELYGAFANV